MSSILDRIDAETRDVINYLKNRNEVCDLNIEEVNGASKNQISEWEIRNFCALPQDLKSFYLNQNGLLIEWKCKIDKSSVIPLGKIQINSIKELTKVGSVLSKDYGEPSIFDLEDLQSSNESDHQDDSNNNQTAGSDLENEHENENESKARSVQKRTKPHFDDSSRNFELDNCNGFGKVCLVYHNTRAGQMCAETEADVWYLDRSLSWHFLAQTFGDYYRLLISHLGLPQWHMLFSDDGLPPFLYQWYYLFTPGRILVQQENWKNLEFLKAIENTSSSINNNKQSNSSEIKKSIDFSVLFDEKQSKSKSNSISNSANANPSGSQEKASSSNQRAKSSTVRK